MYELLVLQKKKKDELLIRYSKIVDQAYYKMLKNKRWGPIK